MTPSEWRDIGRLGQYNTYQLLRARLAEAERVLRLCAGYLADKNAGRVGKFNATAQALEDYFGEPSLRRIADSASQAQENKE